MITLSVALYSLLCLCTTVTSDTMTFHVKPVKPGGAVTMECNLSGVKVKNNLVWYRQRFDDVPQVFARHYGQNNYTFVEGFNDRRFSVTVNSDKFDLNINDVREDDRGEYFCGELDGSTLKFTSGARLEFKGDVKETKPCPTPETLPKNTDSVTRQGSNNSDGCTCPNPVRLLFWLSLIRVGVLAFTIFLMSLVFFKFRLKYKCNK